MVILYISAHIFDPVYATCLSIENIHTLIDGFRAISPLHNDNHMNTLKRSFQYFNYTVILVTDKEVQIL